MILTSSFWVVDLVTGGLLSTYMILPEYFLDSGFATPIVNSCPRLYVLLFITVLIPENEVLICNVADPPTMFKLPPVFESAFALNGILTNPYLGAAFKVPSELNPAFVLSCQYLRTPVFWSYEITLPTAVDPNPTVCIISTSGVKVTEL